MVTLFPFEVNNSLKKTKNTIKHKYIYIFIDTITPTPQSQLMQASLQMGILQQI